MQRQIRVLQEGGGGTYLAGNGLTLTVDTFSINTGITADLASVQTFSGVKSALTASPGTNTTQIATTAFVGAAVTAGGRTAGNGLTLTGNSLSIDTLITADLGSVQTFTGVKSALTAAPGTNTTQIATTAFVTAGVSASARTAGNGLTLTGNALSINTLITADLTTAHTLQNKFLFSAKADQFLDSSGNETLVFTAVGSAVNEVTIGNNSTGNAPTISASGSDTNINLDLIAKGTGTVRYLSTEVGWRIIPSNPKSAAYTTLLTDSGKSIDHPASDANARTVTIDGSLAYPIGTCISGSNMTSQVQSVAITTDAMYLAGVGTTGTRSVAQYGQWTARKIVSGVWLISGSGLT